MASPHVCIITVNYNGGADLKACVASVLTQTYRDYEMIILDNASTDGSLEALGPLPDRIRLIRSPENLGFAAGNNRAAEATMRHDPILIKRRLITYLVTQSI